MNMIIDGKVGARMKNSMKNYKAAKIVMPTGQNVAIGIFKQLE
jgi:hypothetical protein